MWQTFRPRHVHALQSRPGFTANGGTDGTGYGFFVWKQGFDGDTTLSWLDNRLIENRWTRGDTARADPRFPDPRLDAPRPRAAIPAQTALRGVVDNG